ncbi:Protein vip1 [Emydomyces testavorans]|uniref:Protein vip1 n=1 Tax=Emydomyces testavorans TaxID=2070801 RepID=A0AAF0DLM3_9EURO|nr:Protein vip1 [Emydomyces testavorans]
MSTTVHVSNIASATTEKEVRDFFSFCGKITSLSLTPSSGDKDAQQSATVTFEKETAAKTALLLDQTQLGPSSVHVTSARSIDEIAGDKAADASQAKDENSQDLEQEDKPRSRIFAEYLAHGYVISDNAIQRAIEIDKKHGFSNRFHAALANFDKKYHATDKAKGFDESYKITEKAERGWRGLSSYFEKALDTPTGRKIRDFYLNSDKQVRDIHNEARRLADLKREKSPGVEGGEHKERASGDVPGASSGAPASEPATGAPAPATESKV